MSVRRYGFAHSCYVKKGCLSFFCVMGRLCNENGLSVLRQLVYQLIGQSASSLLHAEEHESSQAHVYNSMFILLEITTGSQNRGFKQVAAVMDLCSINNSSSRQVLTERSNGIILHVRSYKYLSALGTCEQTQI